MIDTNYLLRIGQSLNGGRYEIVRHIASGGFGNTYEAIDKTLDRKCAIKEFFMKGMTERDGETFFVSVSNPSNKDLFANFKEKFQKEARRLASLNNRHIVRVFDLFEENNTVYYVMDFINGCSLKEKLKEQNRPFTEAESMNVLNQLLDALETIHGHGLLHMDIKPGNVMIDKDGEYMLIDFGASKQFEGGSALTTSAAAAYTMGYAPSEQISGSKDKWGPWTDFYALGATLYNLISGNTPPLLQDLIDNKEGLFDFPQDVSDGFKNLLKRLLSIRTDERPQSVEQVRQIISTLFSSKDISGQSDNVEDDTKIAVPNNNEETIIPNISEEKPIGNIGLKNNNEKVKASNGDERSTFWILFLLTILAIIVVSIIVIYRCQENKLPADDIPDEVFSEVDPLVADSRADSREMISEEDPSCVAGICPDSYHPHVIDMGEAGKWACCNVGASAPWEFGGYYAWGETEEKNDYTWSSYIHCDGDFESCHTIGDDIASTMYDVAHVKWGGNWCMPNQNQFDLLISKCEYEWTSLNGVEGRKFTGPNGNSIFMPAAGYRWDVNNSYVGSNGYYWSSTMGSDYSDCAYGLDFNSDSTDWNDYGRSLGLSVRPVKE